eukprot:799886_1
MSWSVVSGSASGSASYSASYGSLYISYRSSCGKGMSLSNCQCQHSPNAKIYKVKWVKTPLAGAVADYGYDIFRGIAAVGTLGISTWYNGGLKDSSHEAIQIHFKCVKCNKCNKHKKGSSWASNTCKECKNGKDGTFTYTLHFGKDGKDFSSQLHDTVYKTRDYFYCKSLTFSDVNSAYKLMWSDGYDVVDRNCSHWSSKLFYKLKGLDGV